MRELEALRDHRRSAAPPARFVAITSAARRRQRRAALLTSGVVAASITAAVLVTGGAAAPDSLRTVTPGQAGGVTPTTSPASRPSDRAVQPGPAGFATVSPSRSTMARDTGPAGATGAPSAPASPAAARPPAVQRTYSGTGSQTVCGGIVTSPQSPGGTKYCGDVSATPDGSNITFDIQASLDAASRPSQFSFDTDQEIEIAVYRGGKLIWRWSAGQTFAHKSHELALQPGSSYDWTTTWHAIGPDGHPLAPGDYDVVGTVLATEFGTSNYWDTTFSL